MIYTYTMEVITLISNTVLWIKKMGIGAWQILWPLNHSGLEEYLWPMYAPYCAERPKKGDWSLLRVLTNDSYFTSFDLHILCGLKQERRQGQIEHILGGRRRRKKQKKIKQKRGKKHSMFTQGSWWHLSFFIFFFLSSLDRCRAAGAVTKKVSKR